VEPLAPWCWYIRQVEPALETRVGQWIC
jgi:hypothetical protein